MMHVDIIWVTAAFLSLPLISQSKPLYVMIAPQILKVGTVTNVFVEVQDNTASNEIPVTIRVLNFPLKDTELNSSRVNLTTENQFQSIVNVKIPHMENVFNADSRENQYVYLEAKFPDRLLEKIVLVTFQSGYVLVQTDKTIYTPDSIVKYRIFALDTNLKPVDNQVITEIVTPDGIVVESLNLSPAKGTKTGTYTLASPISYGIWQIAAKFKNNPRLNYTAEFEVKEYVLPSFEVNLNPEKPFFYIDDEKLTVKVQARYLFGKTVEGNAVALFGIMVNQTKITLPKSIQRVPIIGGEGTVELKRDHIHDIFRNHRDLNNRIIFLSVSVFSESGGEMVEAQRGGIHIVTSPYSIHFKRTPKYFKPGMPFDFTVYVTNPDETPVKGVELLLLETNEFKPNQQNSEAITDSNGVAKFSINTGKQFTRLRIKVQTQDPRIRLDRQGVKEMEVYPYNPKNNNRNYLHIDINNHEVEIGDNVNFKLHLGDSPDVQNQDFTYMIISSGKILSVQRFKRSENSQIVLNSKVTKDMLPSFRFVAYYHVGSSEVVSDSVWVDVKDRCMGTLKVKKNTDNYSPSEPITLTITGDPGAKVGLVAVDKAVYVLNNRSRLTQAKIWDYVEKNDIGCTAGSGKDSMGVFYDAGLLFQSDTAGGSENRREFSCPSAPKRRRRDVNILQVKNTLVGEFNGTLRKCCMDGMVKNLLDYTCEHRSEYIEDGEECRTAFLQCCREMIRMEEKAIEEELILAKSSNDDSTEETFENVVTRTFFPESWLWDTVVLPNCSNKNPCETTFHSVTRILKDSITAWVITAIGLSKDNGICIAHPEEIVVQKKFFIDLKLPYSAVVKEQIEIKAVIHNLYSSSWDDDKKVFVELLPTDSICSEASNKRKHRKTIEMAPMSSYTVSFPIVPLNTGEFDIEVRALHRSTGMMDAIKKKLKVVTNGVLTKAGESTKILHPARHGGEQIFQIQRPELKDQMPGTVAKTYIAVKGSPLVQLTEQAVSGEGLGRFIEKPYGCAEQNMMRMALPVIATHYLDKTNRWNDVGVDRRTDALSYISTGVMTELSYRNSDNSFGWFSQSKGNMWLTAYIVKIFSMASSLVYIDRSVICGAIEWLTSKQLQNGAFDQNNGRNILYNTAYVLMALQEGRKVCSDVLKNLERQENQAVAYVEGHILSEKDADAVAIASYTLANAGKLKNDIFRKFLMQSVDGSYWDTSDHLSRLESTGYALLSLVSHKFKDLVAAERVMRWLQKQQMYMGTYGSSKATVVVYQAMAKYFEEVDEPKYPDLVVTLSSTVRRKPIVMKFTKGNEVLRSNRFDANSDFSVTATGAGNGSISFVTLYYTKPGKKKNTNCNFELNVNFEKEPKSSTEGSIESYKLTIEIRFLSTNGNASMTILDISMMTGFKPDTTDLDKLVNGKDRYIRKYEMNKELSEQGSLIIYLNTVSYKKKERIVFKMHKMFNVDSPQPARVSVYEYYSSKKPCVEFYDTQREKGLLETMCRDETCLCAEENCPKRVDEYSSDVRLKTACTVNTDYVFVAALKKMNEVNKTDIYTFTITDIIKEGIEGFILDQQRDFSAHIRCRSKMNLKLGSSYLIMGPAPTRLQQSYWYSLTAQTWLEYWPTVEEREREDMKDKYKDVLVVKNMSELPDCQL